MYLIFVTYKTAVRVNIYESPILSVKYLDKIVHMVLDTGATASLISLSKVQQLKLKILPTLHRAVQVDGITDLKVLGEVHTEFTRGDLLLHFSGLVVNKLGTDVLSGTNFHKENDVYSRMAKDTIVIKGTNIFQSTPVEVMKLDQGMMKSRLVSVRKTQYIIPGEFLELELPLECSPNGVYFVEPKLGQGAPCCLPQVVRSVNNKISIEIGESNKTAPVKVIRNSKPVQIREAKSEEENESNPPLGFVQRFTKSEGDDKVKTSGG